MASDKTINVGLRLTTMAARMPEAIAVVETAGRDRAGKRRYRHVTFRELDADSTRIAAGLRAMGVTPGTRLALLVRPGIDFISLVFALFKSGAVAILVDPGMGRGNLIRCLAEAEPEGFVAVPLVHAIRVLLRRRFPKSRYHVTVGRRWFWGGKTMAELRAAAGKGDVSAEAGAIATTKAGDPAAIIFTSGSTGLAKGVLYSHGNFDAQVAAIQQAYNIQPGEIDLPCFALFGLFNAAMGVTAVMPDMDFSRPATVKPANIVEAVQDWNCTQAFASPAVWARVGPYCQARGIRLESLRRVFSAGAPVPAEVLAAMKPCIHAEGEIHTPYGATEALPVASISASDVLHETQAKTRAGGGVCVGRRFAGVRWRVIGIQDDPVRSWADAMVLPPGEIGELVVAGPMVTREYVTRREANLGAKVPEAEGETVWHRMGDVGYLDDQERFWMCGRMAHRVETAAGPLFSVCCEAIFNQHPHVRRCALVGLGSRGRQRPVIVLQPQPPATVRKLQRDKQFWHEIEALGRQSPLTAGIDTFLLHPALPVDVRHNAKINREQLALWAASRLKEAM